MTSPLKHRHVYPVFRSDSRASRINETPGMTLRQYYAGLALPAVIQALQNVTEVGAVASYESVAKMAVNVADALCEELTKIS